MVRQLTKSYLQGVSQKIDAEGLLVTNSLTAFFRDLDCDNEVITIYDDLQNETLQGLKNSSKIVAFLQTCLMVSIHLGLMKRRKMICFKLYTMPMICKWAHLCNANDMQTVSYLIITMSQSQEICLKLWSTKSSEDVMKNESFLNNIHNLIFV